LLTTAANSAGAIDDDIAPLNSGGIWTKKSDCDDILAGRTNRHALDVGKRTDDAFGETEPRRQRETLRNLLHRRVGKKKAILVGISHRSGIRRRWGPHQRVQADILNLDG
jgi:hypothetical protein